MFLKQKRYGIIKGRGCADGRNKRVYMYKEDTSSPTVTKEFLYSNVSYMQIKSETLPQITSPEP